MIKSFSLILLFTLAFLACQSPDPKISSAEKDYPDVPNAIRIAIQNNLEEQMKLVKKVNTNGNIEEQIIQADSATFYEEMSLLLQYDLNKPAYRGVFDIEKHNDSEGNEIVTLTAKESESPNIISAEFTSRNQQLLHAKWIVKDQNYVYHSERVFDISFAELNSKIILDNFQIAIGQKIIAQDSVWYTVDSKFSKD
ncbi:hypothetical protein ACFCT7_08215 [Fulvivirgaceae bacterium LMO-SS25]